MVSGTGIPAVFEEAVLKCYEQGLQVKTEYDRDIDPPSRDCTMMMEIMNPLKEPMIHKFMPAGPKELECYCMELIEGVKDHLTLWPYTYHKQLCNYDNMVNQIAFLVDKLSETPYSRRAQAITWEPLVHTATDYPPCLQRVWVRCIPDPTSTTLYMSMHTHWRSRAALTASFMNIFGMVLFGDCLIRYRLEQALKRPVVFNRYVDISDSFHIYGQDIAEGNWERFLAKKGQTYNYSGELDVIMAEYRDEIREEIACLDA